MKTLKVGITYNVKKNIHSDIPDAEAEFDDMETIFAIKGALETDGFDTELFEADKNLPVRLLEKMPDVVFNVAEGLAGRGREAQVPAILNFLGIPFTGSDETTMCIAMDKALCKRLAASHGVSTPSYSLFKSGDSLPEGNLTFPVIVKPNTEGSSKGISNYSIVNDEDSLRRLLGEKINVYKQDMLLEEYISGREFTVGILGNGNDIKVFSPMEIIFNDINHSIYSYDVKRNFKQHVRYRCPPDIRDALMEEIENTAKKIYCFLECRDMARIDFRLSAEGQLYFIELNPLPGLAPEYSDFPMLAAFCGMEYSVLICNILKCALNRYGIVHKV